MKAFEKKMRVISRSNAPFIGREAAGQLLAMELAEYKRRKAVVLGIPRGGMVVAGAIARDLKAELDIVISRKLRSPTNPEFAIGAVTESGKVFLDRRFTDTMDRNTPYIAAEKEFQLEEVRRRAQLFREVKDKVPLEKRIVIITDDGLATGSTMQAAIWSVRQEHPAKIVAAIPVAPEDSLRQIADLADETVCLRVPGNFFGVGQFYKDFSQVDDLEVLELLEESGNIYEPEAAGKAR